MSADSSFLVVSTILSTLTVSVLFPKRTSNSSFVDTSDDDLATLPLIEIRPWSAISLATVRRLINREILSYISKLIFLSYI